jgi:hypothetical protein
MPAHRSDFSAAGLAPLTRFGVASSRGRHCSTLRDGAGKGCRGSIAAGLAPLTRFGVASSCGRHCSTLRGLLIPQVS